VGPSNLARCFALILATATSALSADGTLWGPVESGLQLGIDIVSTTEPALRISLKNAGAETRDVVIGSEGSVDLYNVEITTHVPGEHRQPVFDLIDLKARPSSLLLPIVARLEPGEVREFVYPFSRFICVVNRKDVPFRMLAEQGYTVRAAFDFSFARLTTPDLAMHR
jgi:hypothetical protein